MSTKMSRVSKTPVRKVHSLVTKSQGYGTSWWTDRATPSTPASTPFSSLQKAAWRR